MAFFEQQFPPSISAGAQGGPRFLTSKAYMVGGQRHTNRNATYPIHEWMISVPPKSSSEFDQFRAFFYVVGGDADAFRFKDWSDFTAYGGSDPLLNTSATFLTGSTTILQLNRLYTMGSRTFVRPIYKPVSSPAVTVYRNRSGSITSITATVDTTTGQATISGHVAGDTYSWSGQFDVPVAFKNANAIWEYMGNAPSNTTWGQIEIEETRSIT